MKLWRWSPEKRSPRAQRPKITEASCLKRKYSHIKVWSVTWLKNLRIGVRVILFYIIPSNLRLQSWSKEVLAILLSAENRQRPPCQWSELPTLNQRFFGHWSTKIWVTVKKIQLRYFSRINQFIDKIIYVFHCLPVKEKKWKKISF
jgi:hypothetical protein